jgi:hypothetical protein
MNVREFKLINNLGQEYSLMDIENFALMTEPTGLGYSYTTEYEQLGNTFITNLRRIEQGQVQGQVNFLKYDNYKALIDFIEHSEKLRLSYIIPYENGQKEYFKDIQIQNITKTEIQPNGILSESITFDALSLWYSENTFIKDMSRQAGELRWDFTWNARFGDYTEREVDFINDGHTPAPVEITIDGEVINPKIELMIDGELYQEVDINTTIEEYQKLLYGTKENEFYIDRLNTDGSKTSLFDLDTISFENDNVIRLPKEKACTLILTSDNGVQNAQVKIYVYYKAI